MKKNLYDFQKKGIEIAANNFGRLLIADEMGVGKTIQALGIAWLYKDCWPLLIVCPSSLRLNWRDEIARWLPEIKETEVQILIRANQEVLKTYKIIVISYDMCIRQDLALKKLAPKIAIADETHYMKNSKARRTEVLLPILQRCKHVILLTGTPALTRPKELFTQLSIVRPDVFQFFRDFGLRYCDPQPGKWGGSSLEFDGATNLRELHYILSKGLMIRRLKKDVLSQLPPKRRQKISIQTDSRIVDQIHCLCIL